MMRGICLVVILLCAPAVATGRQATRASAGELLTTIDIPYAVLANGVRLAPGTYDVRLTGQPGPVFPGQSPESRQRVEFLRDGTVVGRDVAEVLHDDDLPEVGASSQRVKPGTQVGLLRGGEFLRVSVKKDAVRYLVYLPVDR